MGGDDDRFTSNHFLIVVSVAQSPPVPRLPKWNIEKAKWNIFKEKSSIEVVAEEFPFIDDAIEFLNPFCTEYSVSSTVVLDYLTPMRSRAF